MPTLKQQLTAVLADAGFKPHETTLPHYASGGTFEIVAGVGAVVRVQWWDSSDDERAFLLERFRVALAEAGIEVEERERGLYVPKDQLGGLS